MLHKIHHNPSGLERQLKPAPASQASQQQVCGKRHVMLGGMTAMRLVGATHDTTEWMFRSYKGMDAVLTRTKPQYMCKNIGKAPEQPA
jgi:hypothetical protein